MATTKHVGSFYRPHPRVIETGELVGKDGKRFRPPSRTKQSFVAECDINNILKQYKQTGIISHISAHAEKGAYLDLPDPVEFQDAINMVAQAEQAFSTLPAKVRERFGNSAEAFLHFASDPRNAKEMVDLGLATLPEPPKAPPQAPGQSGGDGGTPPSKASPKAPEGASGAS